VQLPRHLAGLILALGLVGAAVLTVAVLARPSTAALSSTMPAQGAGVQTPPAAISLTFSGDVAEAHLAVSGGVADGDPTIDGPTVRQPVAISAGGRYVVAYHVATRDGGEVSGTLWFTVGSRSAVPQGPVSAPPLEVPSHRHEVDAITGVVIGINLLAALVLGGLLLRHRVTARRRADDAGMP
jgi:copper resistance protein C